MEQKSQMGRGFCVRFEFVPRYQLCCPCSDHAQAPEIRVMCLIICICVAIFDAETKRRRRRISPTTCKELIKYQK